MPPPGLAPHRRAVYHDFLETQLALIVDVGVQNYLQSQMKAPS